MLVPTYTSRLSFAFLPALFGHAFDLALLYWLAEHLDSIRAPRTWIVGAGWIAACQLAYISGVMNTAALVLALVLWALVRRRPVEAGALAAMGLAAAACAVALYYRDFLGMVVDLVPRIAHGAARAPSRYPVQPFWLVAYERTRDFFDTVYPILAAAGLRLMWRAPSPRQRLRRPCGAGSSRAGWARTSCCSRDGPRPRTSSSTGTRPCS